MFLKERDLRKRCMSLLRQTEHELVISDSFIRMCLEYIKDKEDEKCDTEHIILNPNINHQYGKESVNGSRNIWQTTGSITY